MNYFQKELNNLTKEQKLAKIMERERQAINQLKKQTEAEILKQLPENIQKILKTKNRLEEESSLKKKIKLEEIKSKLKNDKK